MRNLLLQVTPAALPDDTTEDLVNSFGIDLFDEGIDDVIFKTNEFLTDATFIGSYGPFWWILQLCMVLGALFAIIMGAGMAYKMMTKGEPFDVMKILRVLGIAIVMCLWYPSSPMNGTNASILGFLSYIPNAIGSFTHDLYEAEAAQVQGKFDELKPLINQQRDKAEAVKAEAVVSKEELLKSTSSGTGIGADDAVNAAVKAAKLEDTATYAGLIVMIDKFVFILSLVLFKVGWWGTIYCQQILLGMLTIFGPLQWAFSVLPKWEGAWAKWITRYLTVHFYGAMLYFVGFYVLLMYDIVFSIQIESLNAIVATEETFRGFLSNAFMTAGYLLVASIVSLKCLNLVPDLAAWMIPEGDTAFSTRNFGEGVSSSVKQSAGSMLGRVM